jgi:hypothetical protein
LSYCLLAISPHTGDLLVPFFLLLICCSCLSFFSLVGMLFMFVCFFSTQLTWILKCSGCYYKRISAY